jgi:hypothetical protein
MAAALMLAVLQPAFASDATVNVKFGKGKSSQTISSSIKGYSTVNYMLEVGGGQVMQVLFSPKSGGCHFNVYEPGEVNTAVFNGSAGGNEFGVNPAKAGIYRFQVYQMRASARRNETCTYSINFEVTGG